MPTPIDTGRVRFLYPKNKKTFREKNVLDGLGIHMSIRGGWVWNLWGRDCVVVSFKNGGTLLIGTDDAENLAGFLERKIGELK